MWPGALVGTAQMPPLSPLPPYLFSVRTLVVGGVAMALLTIVAAITERHEAHQARKGERKTRTAHSAIRPTAPRRFPRAA